VACLLTDMQKHDSVSMSVCIMILRTTLERSAVPYEDISDNKTKVVTGRGVGVAGFSDSVTI
jgi:hypothetical protein